MGSSHEWEKNCLKTHRSRNHRPCGVRACATWEVNRPIRAENANMPASLRLTRKKRECVCVNAPEEISSSVSSAQEPAVTVCSPLSQLIIRPDHIRLEVEHEPTTPVLNDICSGGSQPAAMEVGVCGLHCPLLPPPQRCFSGRTISKLLCSAASAAAQLFVCWGKGAQQAEKQP